MGRRSDASIVFEETATQVQSILDGMGKPVEHEGALLWLADKDAVGQLLILRGALEESCNSEWERKNFSFDKIVKLHSPYVPALWYKLKTKIGYRLINDPQKVIDRLPGLFAIWKNKMRKELDKAAAEYGYTEEELKETRENLEREIEEARKNLDKIMSEPEAYKLCITNYPRRKAYPIVYYADKNGRFHHGNLNLLAPNVLYYEPEERTMRRDAKTEAFLSEAVNVFGDFYAKPKETKEKG